MNSTPLVTIGIPTFNRSAWLKESIESVLNQTFQEFRILVSDNASTDDTPDVVQAFGDSRIDYHRLEQGIGMTANFNRIIRHAESDYVVLLPDDDLLRPEHIETTLGVITRHATLGVVHTGFDSIDKTGRVLNTARLVGKESGTSFESGRHLLWRAMRVSFLVCWSSALLRTQAVRHAGGLRETEQPIADFPLFMRIALDWDFASVGSPLAAIRMHSDAATAREGYARYTGEQYEVVPDLYRRLHEQRRAFLAEFAPRLGQRLHRRYAARAERSYQRDRIGMLRVYGRSRSRRMRILELARLISARPRNLLEPATWRLILTGLWR